MIFYLWFTIFYVILHSTEAIVPRICVENVTHSHICCPVSGEYHQVCGGPERGQCGEVRFHQQEISAPFLVDDRVHWPTRFFTHLCQCRGNFFGISCDECFYGWEGPHCDKRSPLRIRKNWAHMSPKQKHEFLKILQISYEKESDHIVIDDHDKFRADPLRSPIFKTGNIHYYMVYLHRFASRTTLYDSNYMCQKYGYLDFNHDGSSFVTWHRYFMLYWERALGKIAAEYFGIHDFALPFWNWLDTTECEICSNDMAGGEGPVDKFGQRLHPGSTFYNWTEFCSEPTTTPAPVCYGCHYRENFGKITRRWNNKIMPTTEDLDFVMSHGNFYMKGEKDGQPCKSFHMAVEGFCGQPGVNDTRLYMHNFVHNSFDGSMCCSASATNDPLFVVHHVEVDRMVEAWLIDNTPKLEDFPNDNVRPGHCRDCHLVGFFPPIRHSDIFPHSAKEFGYTYENFEFGKQGRVFGTGVPAHVRFPDYPLSLRIDPRDQPDPVDQTDAGGHGGGHGGHHGNGGHGAEQHPGNNGGHGDHPGNGGHNGHPGKEGHGAHPGGPAGGHGGHPGGSNEHHPEPPHPHPINIGDHGSGPETIAVYDKPLGAANPNEATDTNTRRRGI